MYAPPKYNIDVPKLCTIDNCNKKHHAKGYCENHYRLSKKYKNPEGKEKFIFPEDWNLTQETLKEIIYCDPKVGIPIWKIVLSNRTKVGEPGGWINVDGYRDIQINGQRYQWHRLMFLYFHNTLPTQGEVVDHINGIRSDNRLENLRLVTMEDNAANRGNGIYKDRHGNWGARKIGFKTRKEALKAYELIKHL